MKASAYFICTIAGIVLLVAISSAISPLFESVAERTFENPKPATKVERTPRKPAPVRKSASKRTGPTSTQKAQFKRYCLNNLAVVEVNFQSDWQIWVRLKSHKYTGKANVERIAEHLARAYKNQTGYKGLVIVTVWDFTSSRIVAKGRV